jgi:hypothetical protein
VSPATGNRCPSHPPLSTQASVLAREKAGKLPHKLRANTRKVTAKEFPAFTLSGTFGSKGRVEL